MNKTCLYQAHLNAGAKLVDFGGWHMPINYGSQIDEHHAVRTACGIFDVSHMTVIDISGQEATDFLYRLLAGDIKKAKLNQAIYSTMLNKQGGVIDDLIVYKLADNKYRMITNAGTRDKDIAWISQNAQSFKVQVNERPELAIIAIQGPQAQTLLQPLVKTDLMQIKKFYANDGDSQFIGRTGYTGEDGFEVVLPAAKAPELWQQLIAAGAQPCGLGARDTLRLEAGMHLYGQDMDEDTSPLNCGLAWSLRKDNTDYIGGEAIAEQKQAGVGEKLIGLVLQGRGILRHGQVVHDNQGHEGLITSGGFSPTTEKAIALARVPKSLNTDDIQVVIRNKTFPCHVVKLPFVRNGKSLMEE